MHGQPFVAGAEVVGGTEHVGADEHGCFRPPQRDLFPVSPRQDRQELERPDRPLGHDMMWDAEPVRDGDAVAVMPVEQLDDTGDVFELIDPGVVDRIDQPRSAARPKRV